MTSQREHRRLAAILVADIVGFSKMMGDDESGTLAAVNALLDEFVLPTLAEYSGRVVKTLGDGVLAEFASVVDAVQCAVALQRGVAARPAEGPGDKRVRFRIGINLGDIIVQGDDVFGDGVNVASRLEALADPGGILVSAAVFEQVQGKIAQDFADRGAQSVKNIAHPVHAYRVIIDGAGRLAHPNPVAERQLPSVVVLPLDNLSGDAGEDFFADGVTEDIISELSRFPDLFVIARNSAFSYKGKPSRAQDIGRDLGVRYIVEGSIRRSGDRVRVNVQLIDAATGSHVHAEKFDREAADIFALQDEITQTVVASLPGHLRNAESERARRKPTANLAAYDCLMAGRIRHHQVTPQDNVEALQMLDQAIALDPDYAAAYAWKACVLGQALQFGFADDPAKVQEQALHAVHKALALDEDDVECHRLLCEVYMYHHKLEKAVPHAERALALNPNDPRIVAQRGELLTWLGQAAEGVDWIARASRLDPFGAPGRAHLLGRALYGSRRYPEAAQAYRSMPSPGCGPRAELGAAQAMAGSIDEAKAVREELAADCPDFGADAYVARLAYGRREDREHMREGMRTAGL